MRRMKNVVWWSAVAFNVAVLVYAAYASRQPIFCGLGVGSHAVLLYVPGFFALLGTYAMNTPGRAAMWARRVALVFNGVFCAILVFEGVRFSCVDECVRASVGAA